MKINQQTNSVATNDQLKSVKKAKKAAKLSAIKAVVSNGNNLSNSEIQITSPIKNSMNSNGKNKKQKKGDKLIKKSDNVAEADYSEEEIENGNDQEMGNSDGDGEDMQNAHDEDSSMNENDNEEQNEDSQIQARSENNESLIARYEINFEGIDIPKIKTTIPEGYSKNVVALVKGLPKNFSTNNVLEAFTQVTHISKVDDQSALVMFENISQALNVAKKSRKAKIVDNITGGSARPKDKNIKTTEDSGVIPDQPPQDYKNAILMTNFSRHFGRKRNAVDKNFLREFFGSELIDYKFLGPSSCMVKFGNSDNYEKAFLQNEKIVNNKKIVIQPYKGGEGNNKVTKGSRDTSARPARPKDAKTAILITNIEQKIGENENGVDKEFLQEFFGNKVVFYKFF